MHTFVRQLKLPVTAEEAFQWHNRPGALHRLIPPWESVEVVDPGNGITDGSVVQLKQSLGPIKVSWSVKHSDYWENQSFRDTQLTGPFKHWTHLHDFSSDAGGSLLTDSIEYQLPGAALGKLLGSAMVKDKIAAMFEYRHQTTFDDLSVHSRFADQPTQDVAITGSSGLIGSTLTPLLTTGVHRVVKMVRNSLNESDPSALDGVDAVVHLAGENIAGARWNDAVKQRIRDSRVNGTRILCEALAGMPSPPKVLVCASAIGYYGDRGEEVLTEDSTRGEGFLPEVAQEWEAATEPARQAGIRVVCLRFGVVLSPRGGALARMVLPFKLGMGGRVGGGDQYWSWISIDDACGAIHHALMSDSLAGPVNVVSPHPVTNKEFTQVLGRWPKNFSYPVYESNHRCSNRPGISSDSPRSKGRCDMSWASRKATRIALRKTTHLRRLS